MKKIVLIASLFLIAIGLVACGGSENEKGFKVGLALTGPRTDGGFNESAYRGIEQVRDELGAEIVYNENTQPADYEKILRGICQARM